MVTVLLLFGLSPKLGNIILHNYFNMHVNLHNYFSCVPLNFYKFPLWSEGEAFESSPGMLFLLGLALWGITDGCSNAEAGPSIGKDYHPLPRSGLGLSPTHPQGLVCLC